VANNQCVGIVSINIRLEIVNTTREYPIRFGIYSNTSLAVTSTDFDDNDADVDWGMINALCLLLIDLTFALKALFNFSSLLDE
jgi:hypothetical protein